MYNEYDYNILIVKGPDSLLQSFRKTAINLKNESVCGIPGSYLGAITTEPVSVDSGAEVSTPSQNQLRIKFYTQEVPSPSIMKKISAKFPKLSFDHSYKASFDRFRVFGVYHAGKCLDSETRPIMRLNIVSAPVATAQGCFQYKTMQEVAHARFI